jgi:hypothetical protein
VRELACALKPEGGRSWRLRQVKLHIPVGDPITADEGFKWIKADWSTAGAYQNWHIIYQLWCYTERYQ